MSFAVDDRCRQCYQRRYINMADRLGTPEQTDVFRTELRKLFERAPADAASPWFGPYVADLLNDMYGLPLDRYREEKLASNRFVKDRLPEIRRLAENAPDPILAGLQFAILGNYLDFSALQGNVSFDRLTDMLADARKITVEEQIYRDFRNDLENSRELLYLTDNAGEIGFDRIFAEIIARQYPQLHITFCVRGGIAQNDATREDALEMGVPFPVIDNGNRFAGTQMDALSAEADRALHSADVILAKGMGNTETMFGCELNVYYAFLIKCERFVDLFRKEMFTPMFVRDGAAPVSAGGEVYEKS